ncbi:MAG: 30S ribosomal protein S27e [Nitrosopumilus sp.]|nr:30S ribosomal protein S27e [Nitrosopumilus sp.]CAI9832639.1 30S ribosomal protein S27e [Nitrosopumilaceae archaeon]MDA7942175.1 30S ribosomal protein S27e [Nitrosopumilus sp.]MDA7943524.1 30S ribosomal protein S27e [Nitrosopumilus sp.]MDA7944953.1 30S ribosomal protein S27e [Nitrosopumilus sp.]
MRKAHVGVPEPSSRFQNAKCSSCGEVQVVYSHATTRVNCNSCGNALATATGSKARIDGEIVGSAEQG